MEMGLLKKNDESLQRKIDTIQQSITDKLPPVNCPVTHRFAKGMYIREVSMPAGTLIVSKIHKTQHPFIVSKGKVVVSINGDEGLEIAAPFTGITEPGTRRLVFVKEDCVWTTFHTYKTITGTENSLPLQEQELIADKIEKKIIQKRELKVLKNNKTAIEL